MNLIGDVHGKIPQYLALLENLPDSIQVGDMGVGFNIPTIPFSAKHLFFRGNHDSPGRCASHPNCLGDFGYIKPQKAYWMAGADSIDKEWRIPEVSWWRDEELSEHQMDFAIQEYRKLTPRIMLSHDCPQSIAHDFFRITDESRTRNALEEMLNIHAPEFWIFGHHHKSVRRVQGGCKFVCLNELEVFSVPEPS